MNSIEFMSRVEYLLSDLPEEEVRDALDYYRDYLEEAGEAAEDAIREFGSPERIAAIIRSEIQGVMESGGEFTDTGYHNDRFKEPGYPIVKRGGTEGDSAGNMDSGGHAGNAVGGDYVGNASGEDRSGNTAGGGRDGNASGGQARPSGDGPRIDPKANRIVWAILIALLVVTVVPAAVGLGTGALGLLAGLAVLLLALNLLLAALTMALLMIGIAVILTGITFLALNPARAFIWTGAGLIILALGLAALALSVLFYGRFIPQLASWTAGGIRNIFHGRRRRA